LVACGASTTPQLKDARDAYADAEASSARTRAPGDLAEARAALDRAERAHDDNPGSPREAELAERAERKARYAESRGEGRSADRGYRDNIHARSDREPARVRAERIDREERRDNTASPREANAALQGLAQVGTVRQDPRGLVITLSGSLLFPTGEEELSPIGNQNVDRVAHALAQQPKDTTFDIEGYTDSSGSDAENRTLSERRAQAVADRLVTEGIDSSRIRVVGRGEDQPIADNGTDEGRASNRRVEIVVNRHDRG
jgi:outer membrane protein OmpA-like peptidoglycan-associated protein